MKTIPASSSARGEVGVLGQEAVAGVNRLGPGVLRGLDDLLDREVTLGRNRRSDQESFVTGFDVRSIPIRLRINGDGV